MGNRFETLGLLVNALTANDNYSRHNMENSTQQIQMQLSQKPKTFSGFFIPFLKSKSNSVYSEKKINESHRLSISEIIDCERDGYLII